MAWGREAEAEAAACGVSRTMRGVSARHKKWVLAHNLFIKSGRIQAETLFYTYDIVVCR